MDFIVLVLCRVITETVSVLYSAGVVAFPID